ncbi:MAG: hypothetical protein ACYDET_04875 [Thermoleophilia bacterium]
MNEEYDDVRKAFQIDSGNRRFRVTIYMGGFKVVGTAILTMDTRSSSRRTSDFLRNFPEDYMTLTEVQIHDLELNTVIDEPDFILLNVKKIDLLYAKEVQNLEAGHEGEPRV